MPHDLTWIEVEVSDGAFSSEFAVAINTPEGDISLFADRSIVKHEDGKDFLRVTCMGQDAETGEDIVLLPEGEHALARGVPGRRGGGRPAAAPSGRGAAAPRLARPFALLVSHRGAVRVPKGCALGGDGAPRRRARAAAGFGAQAIFARISVLLGDATRVVPVGPMFRTAPLSSSAGSSGCSSAW